MTGSEFQMEVWNQLLKIPYGKTTTYGAIASHCKKEHMSAQAVGGAVGHNEISIIIPCHRVVGTNGSLTGYAGGIDKKISLLELEHVDMSSSAKPFADCVKELEQLGEEIGVKIKCQREEIFDKMHRI